MGRAVQPARQPRLELGPAGGLSPSTTALITSDCGLNATALEHVGPDHLGLLQITNSDATNWGMYTVDLTVYLVGVYELNVLTGGDSHFSRVLPF